MQVFKEIDAIYHAWNNAHANGDADALVQLYAEDAVIESPLIPHLLQQESGVIRGKSAMRELVEILYMCQPEKRKFYRKNYFTDGKTLMWEYPRETPNGDQMDFAEVMEIEDGLIKRHRVYWGWCGVEVLKKDEHHHNLQK